MPITHLGSQKSFTVNKKVDTDRMKFGRGQTSENDSSNESCSKHFIHCCKCYDISELFSTDTKRTTSLSKQSLDSVETQFSEVNNFLR